MKAKRRSIGDFVVFAVAGDMEAYDADKFENECIGIIEKGDKKIIIDLKDLSYISSSGLRALLNIRSRAEKEDGALLLAGLKDKVLEVFRVSNLLKVFKVYDSVTDATGA